MPNEMHFPDNGIIPPHWHHIMLRDERRCGAFRRAIEREVQPGHVVLDVGAGTGLLSYFAAQTASFVDAVEADANVAALGQHLVALNGLGEKVHYAHCRAQDYVPERPVDIVLCEMMHGGLVVEQQVAVLNAVHATLATSFPRHPYRVIPAEAVLYCQLVETDFDYYGYSAPFVWMGDAYVADQFTRTLSPLGSYAHCDFSAPLPIAIDGHCRLVADAAGTANAIRILTQAVLSYDETLSSEERLIDWYLNYIVIPLPETLATQPGDAFQVEIAYAAGCALDQIRLQVRR